MFLPFARFLYWLWQYRSRLRANRLARKGDVEGAINFIEREIESKGPSGERYYILGTLFNCQRQWGKAVLAFEEAAWRGGWQAEYLTSEALALWNLGRCQEAAALMEEGCPRNPQDLDAACNYSLILADLGRWDEAWQQFQRADRICRLTVAFPRSAWRTRKQQVRNCRQLLEEREAALAPQPGAP
jgi:tetratricopeptide (TPR) repeat protein